MKSFALVLILAVLTACAAPGTPQVAPDDAPGTRLTPAEVAALFIGRPWRSEKGEFLFRTDGTYRYKSALTTTEWGPWPYRITEDGSIEGRSATYTFYRIGESYRYYNSETDAFYLAFPDV